MRPATEDTLTTLIIAAMEANDWARAEQLGAQLDELTKPKPPPSIFDSAVWYAAQGLHVFPLRPRDKRPLPRSRGCTEATTEYGQLVSWWGKTPEANVGIATGYVVDVIDIDGALGVHSWANLPEDDQFPPALGTVSTPRPGGTHLFIPASGGGNGAGVEPGIDYRGLGGYVVAPPSVGPTGVVYRWRRPLQLPTVVAA